MQPASDTSSSSSTRPEHAAVTHPREITPRRHRHGLLALNDRALEWITNHVLASIALFDVALVVPLLTLPAPDSVKITLGVISGSWIQWWALPALQRSQNKLQLKADAKADVDHRTLSYLATLQDEQLTILKRLRELALLNVDAVRTVISDAPPAVEDKGV